MTSKFSQFALATAMCLILTSGAASANDMVSNEANAQIGEVSQFANDRSEVNLEVGSLAIDGDASKNWADGSVGDQFFNPAATIQEASMNSKVSAKVGSINAGGDAAYNEAYGRVGEQIDQFAYDGSEVLLEVGSLTAEGDLSDNRANGLIEGQVYQYADSKSKASARIGSIGQR